MKTLPKLILLMLGVTMAACVAEAQKKVQKDTPGWINDPYAAYSEEQYLLAVGSGSTQQDAQNSALANLSKIFQATIETSEKLIDDFYEYARNNTYISERTSQLLTITRVGSSQNLINTKIMKTYAQNGRYYALAGMERFDTARIYTSEITDNEMQIENLLQLAEKEPDPLQKLGYLKNALLLADANRNLASQKSIIQGMGDTELHQMVYDKVYKRYKAAQKDTKVTLQFKGNVPDVVQSGVINALQESGLTISGPNDYYLLSNIRFSTERTHLNRENAVFTHWNIIIEFMNQQNTTIYTYTNGGREGGLSYEDALHRVYDATKKSVEAELPAQINKNLLSN